MASQLWCKICEKAVDTSVTRLVALAVVPLAGALGAAVPKLVRRRLGITGTLLQGALGMGAGYLAQRYLVPRLQTQVCGQCGGAAAPRSAAA